MTNLAVDVETTIYAKGNPFSRRNRLCYVGAYPQGSSVLVGNPDFLPVIRREIVSASQLVTFNGKFDLHWLQRSGIICSDKRLWDCQLAHFLLTSQGTKYPSLNGVCEYYGIAGKDPTIERDYWSKGIDTPDIPPDQMLYYLGVDLVRTIQVFEHQVDDFKKHPQLYRLFRLQCQDLLVLQEMEWNGLRLHVEASRKEAKKIHERIGQIEAELAGKSPRVVLNYDSPDDVSALLYGGTITRERREVVGLYKSGAKVGQPRFRVYEDKFELPRLCDPIKGSELKKEGLWSTDEKTLRQLTGVKPITKLLLERAKLSKQLDYFEGLPNLIDKNDWEPGEIHGQLNQVVAVTGRLSANAPNQQNFDEHIKELLVSRYND